MAMAKSSLLEGRAEVKARNKSHYASELDTSELAMGWESICRRGKDCPGHRDTGDGSCTKYHCESPEDAQTFVAKYRELANRLYASESANAEEEHEEYEYEDGEEYEEDDEEGEEEEEYDPDEWDYDEGYEYGEEDEGSYY